MTVSKVKIVIPLESLQRNGKFFNKAIASVKPTISINGTYAIISYDDVKWSCFDENVMELMSKLSDYPYHFLRIGENYEDVEEHFSTIGKFGEDDYICDVVEVVARFELCL